MATAARTVRGNSKKKGGVATEGRRGDQGFNACLPLNQRSSSGSDEYSPSILAVLANMYLCGGARKDGPVGSAGRWVMHGRVMHGAERDHQAQASSRAVVLRARQFGPTVAGVCHGDTDRPMHAVAAIGRGRSVDSRLWFVEEDGRRCHNRLTMTSSFLFSYYPPA